MLTFTTNHIPGGGAANDEVLIDDVELVYNIAGIQQDLTPSSILISIDEQNQVRIEGASPEQKVEIFRLNGQLLQESNVGKVNGTKLTTGFYFIRCATECAKIYVP